MFSHWALGFGDPGQLTNVRVFVFSPQTLQSAMSLPFRTRFLIICTHLDVLECMGRPEFAVNTFGHGVLPAHQAAQHNIGTLLAPVHCNDGGVIKFGVCFLYVWTLFRCLFSFLVRHVACPCTTIGAVIGSGLSCPTPLLFTVCETL